MRVLSGCGDETVGILALRNGETHPLQVVHLLLQEFRRALIELGFQHDETTERLVKVALASQVVGPALEHMEPLIVDEVEGLLAPLVWAVGVAQ